MAAVALSYRSPSDRDPRSIGDRLDAASRGIDGHFLKLGEILGRALEGLNALVASLDQIQVTLDPQMVAATSAELQAAAQDLLALPEHHADRSRTTRRMAEAADLLATGINDMRRTLAYLRVFAINIKITAGGIASAGAEFGAFAQEICDCIELGRTRLDAFEADLAALRRGFKVAFDQEQILTEQCAGLLPVVPEGLIVNAQAMVAHHQRIGRMAGEVTALVRAVRKNTGLALGALQIGDITRQRIEHVSQALDMLRDVEGLTEGQRVGMEGFIHDLAIAQLGAALEDFHRDVGRIGQAMSGIASDAQDILGLRDLALGRASNAENGFLRQIETHVGQALGLVADMAEADRQAVQMSASVSAGAADLTAQIAELRSIEIDVQFMALNTTLKCGRLGDAGKPLAVIAIELRQHAGHMETSAQAALGALNVLTQDAIQVSGVDAVEAEGFAEAVGDQLSGVAGRLSAAADTVDEALTRVAREGDAVLDGFRRANAQMNFQQEIGAILDQAVQALSVCDGAGSAIGEITVPLGALLERIAKRYTMAQERDVHHELAARLGVAAPVGAPEPEPEPEMDLDAVLF